MKLLDAREILEGFPEGDRAPFLEAAVKKADGRVREMGRRIRNVSGKIAKEPDETHMPYKCFMEVFMDPELAGRIRHRDALKRLKTSLQGDDRHEQFSKLIDRAKQADIIEVAEALGLEVRRQGRNFVCRCPFHDEKTPSFTVYPDQGRYHCYGCGAHGDTLDLYQEIRGVAFKTAVRELSK